MFLRLVSDVSSVPLDRYYRSECHPNKQLKISLKPKFYLLVS